MHVVGFDKSESNLCCDTANPRHTESSCGCISRCLRNSGVSHILGIGVDIMIQRCGPGSCFAGLKRQKVDAASDMGQH
jgi:hypothetical protein